MTTTQYRKVQQAKAQLRDLYSRAKHFRMSGKEILAERKKILSLENVPIRDIEYLRGFADALDEQWQDQLEFCYVIDGKILSVRMQSDRYYEKHGYTPKQLHDLTGGQGHHYYKDTDWQAY